MFLYKEHCAIITRVTFWLKGVVGGKPPVCFLLEVAKCWGVMDWDGNRLPSPAQSSEVPFGGSQYGDAVSDVPTLPLAVTESCVPNRLETRGPVVSSPVDFGHAVGSAWNSQRKRLNLFGTVVFGSAYSVMTVLVML